MLSSNALVDEARDATRQRRRSRTETKVGVAQRGDPVGKTQSEFIDRGFTSMLRQDAKSAKFLKQDREHLIELLTNAGDGSFLRGWRWQFDSNGALETSFPDFCKAAARLNFVGDSYALFGIDQDHSTLTLEELAPKEGQALRRYKEWIQQKFGSPANMFQAFDLLGKGRLTLEQFVSASAANGFGGTADEAAIVFECSDVCDAGCILLEDVLYLETDAQKRDLEQYKIKMSQLWEWKQRVAREYLEQEQVESTLPERSVSSSWMAPRPWLASTFEQLPAVVYYRRRYRAQDEMRRRRQARSSFLERLCELYGNEVRGLRLALDPKGSFRFTVLTLRRFCRKVDLRVDLHDLWKAMDEDEDGFVTLEDLNVRNALALAKFVAWARSNYGSCAAVWELPQLMNARSERKIDASWTSNKKMLTAAFAKALRELQCPVIFDAAAKPRLLASLDLYGCHFVSRSDFEWLDLWRPPEFLLCDPDPDAWSQLKERLVNMFGHPLRAWRVLLDKNNSNHLSWSEFKDACRTIHFDGNAGGAWRALDVDLSGSISMREYDPESAVLLGSFKEWAEVNFGSIPLCFKALDADHSGSITYPELKRACHKLRYQGNIRLLFQCLDVDGKRDAKGDGIGRRSISFDEISFLETWEMSLPDDDEISSSNLNAALRGPRRERRASTLGEESRPSTNEGLPVHRQQGCAPDTLRRPATHHGLLHSTTVVPSRSQIHGNHRDRVSTSTPLTEWKSNEGTGRRRHSSSSSRRKLEPSLKKCSSSPVGTAVRFPKPLSPVHHESADVFVWHHQQVPNLPRAC